MAGVRVIDKRTQEAVEVSSDDARAGIVAGYFGLPDGRVHVRTETGELGSIEAQDVGTALARGWDLLDPETVRSEKLQREESTTAAQTRGAFEALAAGGTLGLSTLAMRELGADPERMAARREALGPAGTALEVGGAIGGALLGTGAAGLAGRVAGSTAGLATRAGAAAEAGLARALGTEAATGLASRVVQKAVPMAGRGMVEGAFFGVGAEIDESVLGDRELTAERLLGAGMMGGLLGAAGEVGLRGLGSIAIGGAKVSKDAVRKVLGHAAGAEGSDHVAKQIAKSYARVTGAPEEPLARILDQFRTPEGRKKLHKAYYQTADVVEDTARTVQDGARAIKSAVDDARMATGGINKLKRVEELLPDNEVFRHLAPRLAAREVEKMASKIERLVATNAEHNGRSFVHTDLDDALAYLGKAAKQLTDDPTGPNSFRVLDTLKQSLDGVIEGRGGMAAIRSGAPTEVVNTIKRLSELNKELRNNLMDEAIWGQAAVMQREMNAAISTQMQAVGKADGVLKRIFDPNKDVGSAEALRITRQYGKFAGETGSESFDAILEAQLQRLKVSEKHYDLAPEVVDKIRRAENEVKKMRSALEEKAEIARIAGDGQNLRSFEGMGSPSITAASSIWPSVGMAAGFGVAGPVGMMLGGLAGSIVRPFTATRTLAGIMHIADQFKGRSTSAVGRFLGSTTKEAARVGAAVGRRAIAPVAGKVAAERREEKHKRVREFLAAASADPDRLASALERDLVHLEGVAPGLAGVMRDKSQRATQFLLQKMPPVFAPPMGGEPLIDSVSMGKFLRYVEAVEDPNVALDRLADRTMTQEHAETLREVYPAIYSDVQGEILEEIGRRKQSKQPVAYADRVQLGVLFGLPLDHSLRPGSQALIQAAHAGSPEQAAPPPQRGGRATRASRLETVTARFEQPASERHA